MSSFSNPHRMYLFNLKNGKKKLAYGESPENAPKGTFKNTSTNSAR